MFLRHTLGAWPWHAHTDTHRARKSGNIHPISTQACLTKRDEAKQCSTTFKQKKKKGKKNDPLPAGLRRGGRGGWGGGLHFIS